MDCFRVAYPPWAVAHLENNRLRCTKSETFAYLTFFCQDNSFRGALRRSSKRQHPVRGSYQDEVADNYRRRAAAVLFAKR